MLTEAGGQYHKKKSQKPALGNLVRLILCEGVTFSYPYNKSL